MYHLLLFGLGGWEIAFVILIICLMFGGPLLAIIHALTRPLDANLKLIWVLVSIFIPFGWVVYFLFYWFSPNSQSIKG